MARRPPVTDKTTLLGIPAPASYDEVPPRAPATPELGAKTESEPPSAPVPTDPETEPSVPEGQPTNTDGFDPYRFGANSFPPGLRSELIRTKLPRVDPEELKDTLPPNTGLEALAERPTGRGRWIAAATLALLAVGTPVAWVAFSSDEETAKTTANAREQTAVPTAARSSEASTGTTLSIPPPKAENLAATARQAAEPPAEPAEVPREEARTPKASLTSAASSQARALRTAAVQTPSAIPQSPTPPPRSTASAPSGTASNGNLFELPVGPKPQ